MGNSPWVIDWYGSLPMVAGYANHHIDHRNALDSILVLGRFSFLANAFLMQGFLAGPALKKTHHAGIVGTVDFFFSYLNRIGALHGRTQAFRFTVADHAGFGSFS